MAQALRDDFRIERRCALGDGVQGSAHERLARASAAVEVCGVQGSL
jgi:hypothetical protein